MENTQAQCAPTFTIEVTQYIRPDGLTVKQHTEIRQAFEAPYRAIRLRGWRVAAECLESGMVSVAVEDDEQDYASELAKNGPAVQYAIERCLAAAICTEPQEPGDPAGWEGGFADNH
jgi:hypothetical protein